MTLFANLNSIQKGRKLEPPRIALYGVEGVGKSEWAASCPRPIVIQTENGLKEIDVDKWPVCTELHQVENYLDCLIQDNHSYGTVCIDTLSSLQKLIFKQVARDNNVKGIDEIGWNKGPKYALVYWQTILDKLDELQEKKKMVILLTGHSVIKSLKLPDGDPFDRYELDLQEDASKMVREWVDIILFCNFQTFTPKVKTINGKETVRPTGTDERFLYTTHKPIHQAKNRYGFPEMIEYPKDKGWQELSKYFRKEESSVTKPKVVKSNGKTEQVDHDNRTTVA